MQNYWKTLFILATLLGCQLASAAVIIPLYATVEKGKGEYLGMITIYDTELGLAIEPDLKGLRAGMHGLHVHENASCEDFGSAAGLHFDPFEKRRHRGPFDPAGHLGDLPVLIVDADGTSKNKSIAPRLLLSDIRGRAMIIHEWGDNYRDVPQRLGGGGARIGCGIIP